MLARMIGRLRLAAVRTRCGNRGGRVPRTVKILDMDVAKGQDELQRQRKQRQSAAEFCVRPEPTHSAPIHGCRLLYYNIRPGKPGNQGTSYLVVDRVLNATTIYV